MMRIRHIKSFANKVKKKISRIDPAKLMNEKQKELLNMIPEIEKELEIIKLEPESDLKQEKLRECTAILLHINEYIDSGMMKTKEIVKMVKSARRYKKLCKSQKSE